MRDQDKRGGQLWSGIWGGISADINSTVQYSIVQYSTVQYSTKEVGSAGLLSRAGSVLTQVYTIRIHQGESRTWLQLRSSSSYFCGSSLSIGHGAFCSVLQVFLSLPASFPYLVIGIGFSARFCCNRILGNVDILGGFWEKRMVLF